MGRVHIVESATINAQPDAVYAVFRNYIDEHPKVLPSAFTSLEVEEGGIGAGTVFKSKLKVMGNENTFRMRVEEPEPGRILSEHDLKQDLVTNFIIDPGSSAGQAHVTIETIWNPPATVRGWIESKLTPRILHRLYKQELQNLADYMQKKQQAV